MDRPGALVPRRYVALTDGSVRVLAQAAAGEWLRFCSNVVLLPDGSGCFTVSGRRYPLGTLIGDLPATGSRDRAGRGEPFTESLPGMPDNLWGGGPDGPIRISWAGPRVPPPLDLLHRAAPAVRRTAARVK